jgi:hypothetical protein
MGRVRMAADTSPTRLRVNPPLVRGLPTGIHWSITAEFNEVHQRSTPLFPKQRSARTERRAGRPRSGRAGRQGAGDVHRWCKAERFRRPMPPVMIPGESVGPSIPSFLTPANNGTISPSVPAPSSGGAKPSPLAARHQKRQRRDPAKRWPPGGWGRVCRRAQMV